jgi:hypothetical protein
MVSQDEPSSVSFHCLLIKRSSLSVWSVNGKEIQNIDTNTQLDQAFFIWHRVNKLKPLSLASHARKNTSFYGRLQTLSVNIRPGW